MIQKILLPRLGETMDEAEIARWLKAVGDPVKKGDVLLEITTDKATLEVESTAAGTLRQVLAQPGCVVPVNGPIALVGDPTDALPEIQVSYPLGREKVSGTFLAAKKVPDTFSRAAPVSVTSQSAIRSPQLARAGSVSPRARRVAQELGVPTAVLTGSGPGGRVIEGDVLAYAERLKSLAVSPAAQRLAVERGVDLTRVTGTGPRGRITREDVEGALAAPEKVSGTFCAQHPEGPFRQKVPDTFSGAVLTPLSPMRRIIAERMSASKREIPHYYLMVDVAMTAACAFREEWNASARVRVTFNDLVLKAAALAAREVPAALARFSPGGILPVDRLHIGLAVALEEGLIVPVVRDVDRLHLEELAQASASLVERARRKRLLPEETQGGCLTITNLGMFGVDHFLPIIQPGESAILGLGRIAPQPAVVEGRVEARQMMSLSLAVDHRAVDGAVGARFLAAVKGYLEGPQRLDG